MVQYEKMYAILCKGASDALNVLPFLPENIYARYLLEKALADAEELYIGEDESWDVTTTACLDRKKGRTV